MSHHKIAHTALSASTRRHSLPPPPPTFKWPLTQSLYHPSSLRPSLSPKVCPHLGNFIIAAPPGLCTNFYFSLDTFKKKKKDKTPNLGLGALNSAIQDVFAPVDDLSLRHMAPAESFMDWQPAAASAGSGGTKSLTHMPSLGISGRAGVGWPHSLYTGFLLSAQEHSSFGEENGGCSIP